MRIVIAVMLMGMVACGDGSTFVAPPTPNDLAGKWEALQPGGNGRIDKWDLTITVDRDAFPATVTAVGTRTIPTATFPIRMSGPYTNPGEPIMLTIDGSGSWLPGYVRLYTWEGKPNIGYNLAPDLDQLGDQMTFSAVH